MCFPLRNAIRKRLRDGKVPRTARAIPNGDRIRSIFDSRAATATPIGTIEGNRHSVSEETQGEFMRSALLWLIGIPIPIIIILWLVTGHA
jgi:hypothetical protein